jgi:hypothetical protein
VVSTLPLPGLLFNLVFKFQQFSGPNAVGKGLAAAIKDTFKKTLMINIDDTLYYIAFD